MQVDEIRTTSAVARESKERVRFADAKRELQAMS